MLIGGQVIINGYGRGEGVRVGRDMNVSKEYVWSIWGGVIC